MTICAALRISRATAYRLPVARGPTYAKAADPVDGRDGSDGVRHGVTPLKLEAGPGMAGLGANKVRRLTNRA